MQARVLTLKETQTVVLMAIESYKIEAEKGLFKKKGIKRADAYSDFVKEFAGSKTQLVKVIFEDIATLNKGRLDTSTDLRENLIYALCNICGKSKSMVVSVVEANIKSRAGVVFTPMGAYGTGVATEHEKLQETISELSKILTQAGILHKVDPEGNTEMSLVHADTSKRFGR